MFRIEYNNGTFADVPMNNSGFNIIYDFTQTGETEITVNFLGFSHTVEVTVLEGPDWELIGDMTEKAIGHIYLLEEPQFLYCYFRLMEEVDKVYATKSLKVVVYYIDNYFEGVEEVKQLCEENTYYYAPEFFNDEVLNEYIRLFTDLIYKWKTVEGYGVTSQEFCTQTEQLISAYEALSRYQRWTFIFNMYSAYDYYIEVTAEYYSQYLSEQELEVYKMLVQSEFYYNGSKTADYGYHIDLFIRRTRDLIKLYEALSDSETFDELFLEEYNVYGDYLIELDPYAEEIYELNDFTIEITLGLILKILAGGDLSHLIVSYEIFFEMVQAIYDSDDADLIYEFETATVGDTTLYAKYEKYLEEYNALMEEISAKGEEFVEFYRGYLDIYRKWVEAGAGMSEKAGPADREMYPEFDTDVENFIQELEQLPQDLYDYFMSIASASYTKILKDHTDNS